MKVKISLKPSSSPPKQRVYFKTAPRGLGKLILANPNSSTHQSALEYVADTLVPCQVPHLHHTHPTSKGQHLLSFAGQLFLATGACFCSHTWQNGSARKLMPSHPKSSAQSLIEEGE